MKKYKTEHYGSPEIMAVDVEKETDKCVWIKGRRQFKKSSYENIFDSFEAAHEFLINKALSKVGSSKRRLEDANDDLAKIRALTEVSP